jgi:hypothetical protein
VADLAKSPNSDPCPEPGLLPAVKPLLPAPEHDIHAARAAAALFIRTHFFLLTHAKRFFFYIRRHYEAYLGTSSLVLCQE